MQTTKLMLRNHLVKSPTGNPADDFEPYLEVYLQRATASPLGAVIVVPGGGYHARALHEGAPIAAKFTALGFHTFVLQYRVNPYLFPAPQQDILRAVKLIRSKAADWRLRADQIAVLGFSAGGHLAASAGVMHDRIDCSENDEADAVSGRPDAMILCYPVIAASEPFAHRGSMVNLLGAAPDQQQLAAMDLHKFANENTPPTFIWHTAEDALVPVRNSVAFAEKMWSCGGTCELHVFPHGPHGRGLGLGWRDLSQWPALAAKFLEVNAGFSRAEV